MVSVAAPFTELSLWEGCADVDALPSKAECLVCVFPGGCWEVDGEEGREEDKEVGPTEERAGEGEFGALKGSFSGGLATMREAGFEREFCVEFKGEREGLEASKGEPCLIVEREDPLKLITPFAPG